MILFRNILITLLILCFFIPASSIAGPYIELGVGVTTRDVIEEGLTETGETILTDPPTGVGRGIADSTRSLSEIGWNFGDRVTLYGNIGAVDLKIDEFDDFNSDFEVALGGGAKINWYTSPGPNRLSLFTDFSVLTFSASDTVSGRFEDTFRVADEDIRLTEYTLKLGVSMVHPTLDQPYAGIRLSTINGSDTVSFRPDQNFSTAVTRKLDITEDDNFGLFAGTTFFFDQQEKAGLNIELNIIDEFSFITAFRLNF